LELTRNYISCPQSKGVADGLVLHHFIIQ
jgi:hypothetical protein